MGPYNSIKLFVLLAVYFAVTGCGAKPATKNPAPSNSGGSAKAHEHADDHDHPSKGPHGGQIIELGDEEYHAELTHDDSTDTITLYLLDSSAAKAALSEAGEAVIHAASKGKPVSFSLKAKPMADDKDGKASRFELVDKSLGEALDASDANARLSVTIAGKPYSTALKPHGSEGHKH